MADFSGVSRARLDTCDPRLVRLFDAVLKEHDCMILAGFRDAREQNLAFSTGHSKLRWPHSKHNTIPSSAVDAAPYPLDWNDLESFRKFGQAVLETARKLGIPIRWGGDWDGKGDGNKPGELNDLVHFELITDGNA